MPILSRFLARPIHLFRFDLGPVSFAYASGDTSVELGGLTYLASGISRGALRSTPERNKNQVTISMPMALDPLASDPPPTQPFAQLWRPYPPAGTVYVTCMALDRSQPGAAPEVEWVGRVAQPRFTDTALELTCTNTLARHRVATGGRRCQRSCDLVVYSQGLGRCNLNPDTWEVPAVLTAAAGLTITAPEFAVSAVNMAGGWVEWVRADGITDQRTIMEHDGETLALDFGAPDLAPGLAIRAWPGCAQTWEACEAFGNTDNYGGFYYLPTKNPWKGNPP